MLVRPTRETLRWVLVIFGAIAIVLLSYRLLIPDRPRLFPADHGVSAVDRLGLNGNEADFYKCVVRWAEASAGDLRIGNDWTLEVGARNFAQKLEPGSWGIHIDSARSPYDVDAAFVDGAWLAELGPSGYGRYEFLLPCPIP